METRDIKLEIIKAGERAVRQLIKVAKEEIIKPDPEDICRAPAGALQISRLS